MRRSPLSHPLAVLRTTIGLTQKEMGDLVKRAARTIQSIELCKLPLTEELALRVAEATGVDEGWLFAGDPLTPPRKGLTLQQIGHGQGDYTRADYEYHRAFLETPIASPEQLRAAIAKAKTKGRNGKDVAAVALAKLNLREKQAEIIRLIDIVLVNQLALILLETKFTEDMRLVRWKLRRFLDDLASEFSLKIPQTNISIKALTFANQKPAPNVEAGPPPPRQQRKSKA